MGLPVVACLLVLAALCLIPQPSTCQTTCTSKCPGTSTCGNFRGAPICSCPMEQHLVNKTCTTSAQNHSDWLEPMNNARAAVGAPPLIWDAGLAVEAQAYADKLGNTSGCALKHDVAALKLLKHGQNLAGGPQNIGSVSISDAVYKWVAEANWYNYHVFDGKGGGCTAPKGKTCGHYTQVIWSATTAVGCGVSHCKSGAFSSRVWVCNYNPAGNIINQLPYTIDPCFPLGGKSKCPATATCNGTSGVPVCTCPSGESIVKGACAKDPCLGVSCKGDLVCNGSTGVPQCQCQGSFVPASPGSSSCIPPQCFGVTCPPSSVCSVGALSAPACLCPSGSVLQGGSCTTGPVSPVITTNLALYNSTSSIPLVIRFSKKNQCLDLKGFKINAYKIVWNAPLSQNGSLPLNVSTAPCSQVQFWDGKNCFGTSKLWKSNQGNINQLAQGGFKTAIFLKCA